MREGEREREKYQRRRKENALMTSAFFSEMMMMMLITSVSFFIFHNSPYIYSHNFIEIEWIMKILSITKLKKE